MSVADRIIRERNRLGLSQAEFARQAGVSISSQKRYEKGERSPDAAYLEKVEAFGVDGAYLAFGIRPADCNNESLAVRWLLTDIAVALAVDRDAFMDALGELSDAVVELLETDRQSEMNARSKTLVRDVLSMSPFFDTAVDEVELGLDVSLLAELVECFEDIQQRFALRIAPRKKAQSIAMLWRATKKSGEIAPAMIEDAARLAAG
jgi:transcriptional regulator with XRE-family HTH domain